MKALIYGLGRSGRGVARFVNMLGWDACWFDSNPQPEDLEQVSQLGLEQARLPLEQAPQWTIAAPGVPIDHPDLEQLRAQGSTVIGELELGFLTRDTPMIAVTGTAGKTGTVSLIAQLLRALEVSALEGGNFDPPLLDIIDRVAVAVVEVSSFQLERVQRYRPRIAVITNLGTDHLNRHRTLETYHATKLNLARHQTPGDVLIAPPEVLARAGGQAERIALELAPQGIVDREGTLLLEPEDIPGGLHPANLQAAVYAVQAYFTQQGTPLSVQALRFALHGLLPVEGRFQALGQIGGVTFISDSIATRTLAVRSALERAPAPIAWILGGRDKGAELPELEEVVRTKVTHILAIGTHGEKLAAHFGKPITPVTAQATLETGYTDMHRACEQALEVLDGQGSVVLAPLCESFDQFRDYKDRARAFFEAFMQLGGQT